MFTAAVGVRARVNKRRLGLEVRVERSVVVEMLVTEVGEAHRRELRAVDAVLVQRMRRHLHRHGAGTRVAHPREQRLQVAPFGRGVRAPSASGIVSPEPRAHGADHTHSVTGASGDGLEQVRGGGLPVRAGDTEHSHRGRRLPEEDGGHRPERSAHARHLRLDHRERERALHEQRDRAPGHRIRRVVVAVGDGTGDAREARPRGRPAAVVGDRLDLDVGVPGLVDGVVAGPSDLEPGPVETGEQVVPTHAGASSRVGHGIGQGRVPGGPPGPDGGPLHEVGTRW